MSESVVYEGYAKSPVFRVEFGSHEHHRWSSRGDAYTSLESAKREAARHEARGLDTRIVQIGIEVSR